MIFISFCFLTDVAYLLQFFFFCSQVVQMTCLCGIFFRMQVKPSASFLFPLRSSFSFMIFVFNLFLLSASPSLSYGPSSISLQGVLFHFFFLMRLLASWRSEMRPWFRGHFISYYCEGTFFFIFKNWDCYEHKIKVTFRKVNTKKNLTLTLKGHHPVQIGHF